MYVNRRITASFAVGMLFFLAGFGLGTRESTSLEWTWKYTGQGIEARGILVTSASPTANGNYSILSITGSRNGVPIVSLQPAGTPIQGNSPYIVDNLVGLEVPQLTNNGIGYGLANGAFCSPFAVDSKSTYLEFYSAPPIGQTSEEKGPEDTEKPINFEAEVIPTFEWYRVPLGLGLLMILCATSVVAMNKLRSKSNPAEKPSTTGTKG